MKEDKKNIVKLDKADSGYAFGTLWQEATNAMGNLFSSITNWTATRQKTQQLYDYENIQGRLNWSESVLKDKQSNTGFYIIGGLLLIGLLGGIIYLGAKKKK